MVLLLILVFLMSYLQRPLVFNFFKMYDWFFFEGEAERIRRCRGRIFALKDEPEVARVWLPHLDSPGLAMARAFGDFCLKDFGLISVPEVSYRLITEKDDFIILATDGVRWIQLCYLEISAFPMLFKITLGQCNPLRNTSLWIYQLLSGLGCLIQQWSDKHSCICSWKVVCCSLSCWISCSCLEVQVSEFKNWWLRCGLPLS